MNEVNTRESDDKQSKSSTSHSTDQSKRLSTSHHAMLHMYTALFAILSWPSHNEGTTLKDQRRVLLKVDQHVNGLVKGDRILRDQDTIFVGIDPVSRSNCDPSKTHRHISEAHISFGAFDGMCIQCFHTQWHPADIIWVSDAAIYDHSLQTTHSSNLKGM